MVTSELVAAVAAAAAAVGRISPLAGACTGSVGGGNVGGGPCATLQQLCFDVYYAEFLRYVARVADSLLPLQMPLGGGRRGSLVSTLPDLPFLTLVLKYCACCLLRGYVPIANTLSNG